jgi:hypothetical protein
MCCIGDGDTSDRDLFKTGWHRREKAKIERFTVPIEIERDGHKQHLHRTSSNVYNRNSGADAASW